MVSSACSFFQLCYKKIGSFTHIYRKFSAKEVIVAKRKKTDVLYKTVKFEVFPNEEQEHILWTISCNLALVWNEGLAERRRIYDEFLHPLYEELKEVRDRDDAEACEEIEGRLRTAREKHRITHFDQNNALTPRRDADEMFAAVPRNWQEETLSMLAGDFVSFFTLRRNGDLDARPPGPRKDGDFCQITGRMGFRYMYDPSSLEGSHVVLSCKNLSKDPFVFPLPKHQAEELRPYVDGVKKFILSRDERDPKNSGRFWLSLSYEFEKPEEKPFIPEDAVYVALGASYIGIVSPKGEEVVKFWRPDKHWQPRIERVKERMKALPKKGSLKWQKQNNAKRAMEKIKSRQQRQNHREVVAKLLGDEAAERVLGHGVHFVVSEMIVRSKEGKIADSSKKNRGGVLGLNWSAQNTGSIAEFVAWLRIKAAERGGTVRTHRLSYFPKSEGTGRDNKIALARALRESFLSTMKQ